MKALKHIIICVAVLVMVLGFSMQAHADLELLGQGTSAEGTYNLIYDSDQNITWYDYTRSVANGHYWDNHLAWANDLSVTFEGESFSDWRMPATFDESCIGDDCTNSEMGHLYYTTLENTAGTNGLVNTDVFENLLNHYYFSETVLSTDSYRAWIFAMNIGYQTYGGKSSYSYIRTIAVMDGMAVVPEPMSMILFGVGGATLGFRRFWKKRRTA